MSVQRSRFNVQGSTALAVLLVCGIASADVDPRLKVFAAQKRQQTEELAGKLHLDVPAEAREFFRAAEAGDWVAVSNSFERIRPVTGTNGPLPGLNNVLYVPIHETLGAYATFRVWDGTMLQKFADGILNSMPTGSVFFGGTDPGRFVITTVRDVAGSPDVFVATPKFLMTPRRAPWEFVVTQNAVVDSHYMNYLRLVYGEKLWVPSETDMQNAFQKYVTELQSRGLQSDGRISTNQDGPVGVSGAEAVFTINGAATKMIFDHNKDKHEFYVEESYVIPWMYPYLEPHGLIMKLSKEPFTALDPNVVTQDRQYWATLTKELLADRRFIENAAARMTFSKLRSAIGGLYTYRHLTSEAEAAFKQAITLCPASPEANFRLAQLYMEQSRGDDAVAVLERLQKLDVFNGKVAAAIEQIRKVRSLQGDEKK